MRDLRELLTSDPAWPKVVAMVRDGESASVLPLERAAGERALWALQVTDRSPMGSIALNCGGIVAEGGWLLVFGGGDPGLVTWNHTPDGAADTRRPSNREVGEAVRVPVPENVPGDWYVEAGCCITCAVPVTVAPDLFRWAVRPDGSGVDHCYVSRQPVTDPEVDRMIEAAWGAEVECIRYKGIDARIRARISDRGADNAIDVPDSMLKR